MSDFFGTSLNEIGPSPASYQVGGQEPASGTNQIVSRRPGRPLDPRVRWANSTRATLVAERSAITKQMLRNEELYRGKHWTSPRAPWKNSSKVNYCFIIPETHAAILSDNKPRAAFSTYRTEDQEQADIATAAWNDEYSYGNWQSVIESAIKLSSVVKKGFLRLDYDPYARDGRGAQRLTSISGAQVFANREATTVDDASLLMLEYTEPEGSLLLRFPHLVGKLQSAERRERDPLDMASQQRSPALNVTTPIGSYSVPPFAGPPSQAGQARGTGGVVVREFWTRPKGPNAQTKVKTLEWTAANKPAVRPKFLEMADGRLEPLYTVVTAANVVYELPLTQLELMRFCADNFGGLQIAHSAPAYEAVMSEKRVPLYATGRRLVIVGDEVADDGCNPYAHGEINLIEIDAYKDVRHFFGISDIDQIADLQEYLNRLYSLLLDAAILTSNPAWIIPNQTETADEDITNAPGAIIRVDPMFFKSGANRRAGPDMPRYVFDLLNWTISQIREISGLTEAATGGKFKGQVAAETVSMYQEAAGVRFRQRIRNVEQAIVKLGRQFVSNMRQFYTTPRMVRIEIAAGMDQAKMFTGRDLSSEMQLRSKNSSMLPTSPSARISQMMQLLNLPIPTLDLPEIFQIFEEYGMIESADKLLRRIEKAYAPVLGPEMWKQPMAYRQLMGGGGKKAKGNSGRSAKGRSPSGAPNRA